MRTSVGKALEHRSALTPTTAKALIDAGYTVNVERSPERIFDDNEFEKVGATLVPENTWREAPSDHIIIGLKELPVEECKPQNLELASKIVADHLKVPLRHVHIQFAHCYKQQGGWEKVLSRFPRGGGTLLDLEFLTDDKGRRVAAVCHIFVLFPGAERLGAISETLYPAVLAPKIAAKAPDSP
jgi:saccharopine dehydrogenase (NAD+, L-lysine-forming)